MLLGVQTRARTPRSQTSEFHGVAGSKGTPRSERAVDTCCQRTLYKGVTNDRSHHLYLFSPNFTTVLSHLCQFGKRKMIF